MTPVAVSSFRGPQDARAPASCLRFRVEGWRAFSLDEHRRSEPALLHHQAPPSLDRPVAENPPAMLRRRVSAVGQMALRAAFELGGQVVAPRFVFCSRHGEFQRTLSLLRAVVAREPESPADFSLSVHNALVGLLSIALRNREGHTAVAAGRDSFGYGMLEALACLAEAPATPVLVVYFDEALPGAYRELDEKRDSGDAIALALLLSAGGGGIGELELVPEARGEAGVASADGGQAAAFLDFLRSGARECIVRGARTTWRWTRAD